MVFDEATIKQFWATVDIKGPDECWPWKGQIGFYRYGIFKVCQDGKRKARVASRVALAISSGQCPPSLCCLHGCDNPPCCNPKHLSWGTKKKNNQEAFERIPGRREHQRAMIRRVVATGAPARALAKLTPQQVCEINTLLRSGLTQEAIAGRFGVSQQTISRVFHGRIKLYRT